MTMSILTIIIFGIPNKTINIVVETNKQLNNYKNIISSYMKLEISNYNIKHKRINIDWNTYIKDINDLTIYLILYQTTIMSIK